MKGAHKINQEFILFHHLNAILLMLLPHVAEFFFASVIAPRRHLRFTRRAARHDAAEILKRS